MVPKLGVRPAVGCDVLQLLVKPTAGAMTPYSDVLSVDDSSYSTSSSSEYPSEVSPSHMGKSGTSYVLRDANSDTREFLTAILNYASSSSSLGSILGLLNGLSTSGGLRLRLSYYT